MIRYFWKGQKLSFALMLLLITLDCFMEVGTAYIMSLCIELAVSGNVKKALSYAAGFGAYILVYFAVDFAGRKMKYTVLKNVRNHLRDDALKKITGLPHEKFYERTYSEWVSVLVNDIDLIDGAYFNTILTVFPSVLTLAVSLILLLYLSPVIAAFIIVLAAVQMSVPKVMGHKIAESKERLSQKNGGFMDVLTDHLQGFDLLRSFHLTDRARAGVEEKGKELEMERYQSRFLTSVAMLLSFSFGQVMYIGVYLLGAVLAAQNMITIGSMVAATQLSVYVVGPLESMSSYIAEIISAKKVMAALWEVMEQQEDEEQGCVSAEGMTRGIAFEKVNFSYGDMKILEDADYVFEKGKKYLLNSASGTGKSTVVHLLTKRLYPQGGIIKLDGMDIGRISAASYARIVSACDQVNVIFHATVKNNITLFDESCPDTDIYEAIRSVGLDYLFSRNGYSLSTVLEPGGSNLSGGEKQRIALARLELLQPSFLILDESFANLDYESMTELLRLVTADKNRTVLYVAHQLTTEIVKLFDQVIEIRDFKIREKEV